MKEGEISPPRPGRAVLFPDPGGEMLRWAKRRWSFHDLELYFHQCAAKIYVFCALFLRRQSEGVQKGMLSRRYGRSAASSRRVLIILLKS